MIITEGDAVTWRPFENPISCFKQDELDSWMLCCHPMWINIVWVMPQITRGINRIGFLVGEMISFTACTLGWMGLSRGSRRAGTVVQWRWSSLPGSSGGTRRSASLRAPCASRSAWAREGSPGTRRDRASCTRAPPGPAPPGSPYLSRRQMWNRVDVGHVSECGLITRQRMWVVIRGEQPEIMSSPRKGSLKIWHLMCVQTRSWKATCPTMFGSHFASINLPGSF